MRTPLRRTVDGPGWKRRLDAAAESGGMMLERFRKQRRNREIVDALYLQIVDAARSERLFADLGLPDTVMGRYEALSIHVFLFLARCRDDERLKPVAQDVVDRFTSDLEDSIREIGIGDVTVPKRMRKLVGMFYERVAAYDQALGAADAAALEVALARYALDGAPGNAAGLAAYMHSRKAEWDGVATDDILDGRLITEERLV